MINVGSLFAGVGGICLGFKNAGFNVIWANEIDKNACITYKLNHKSTTLIENDINNVLTNSIPDLDILTAGFPCQAFSIAGYQKGFNDERGNLFFSILRIIKEKKEKPKIIFLENVKNLISHNKGGTFKIILSKLHEEGYFIKYKVLNSCEYGNVPQNRERIYIIGFLDEDLYHKFNFPEKIELLNHIESIKEHSKLSDKFYYKNNSPYYNLLSESITNNNIYQLRRIYVRENKSNVCPTLTANMGTGGHNVPILKDKYGIRKLTPRECFNLQGFSSNFLLPDIANSHLYKQAGNSVTVSVVERIAKIIASIL